MSRREQFADCCWHCWVSTRHRPLESNWPNFRTIILYSLLFFHPTQQILLHAHIKDSLWLMASEQELQSKSGLCELQTRLLMLCESMSWDVTLCRADSLIHCRSIGRCWWYCIFWQADISPQSWSLSGCDNNASDESYCSKNSLLKESSMPWGLIRYFDSWSWFNIVEGNVGVVFLMVTMMVTFVVLLILMLIRTTMVMSLVVCGKT